MCIVCYGNEDEKKIRKLFKDLEEGATGIDIFNLNTFMELKKLVLGNNNEEDEDDEC